MNIEDLYGELSAAFLSIHQKTDESYIECLERNFRVFDRIVLQCDEIFNPCWQEIIAESNECGREIIECVQTYLGGCHHRAYSMISNLMDSSRFRKTLDVIENGSSLYRMRSIEGKNRISRGEMFHIPFNNIDNVPPHRYSVPGFPCLYLCSSLYCCWEELGRPDLNSCMFSLFSNTKYFLLLDLRFPSREKWITDYSKLIPFFKVIIASRVIVKKQMNPFKPEYIIPQLITEYIIENNTHLSADENDFRICGICYTSSRYNNDFEYPLSVFDCIAIPAVFNREQKYSSFLSELFELTSPTCEEFERIKSPRSTHMYMKSSCDEKHEYSLSLFGQFEGLLEETKNMCIGKVE